MIDAPMPMAATKTATRSFRLRDPLPDGPATGVGIIPEVTSSLARSSGDMSSAVGSTTWGTPKEGSSPGGGGGVSLTGPVYPTGLTLSQKERSLAGVRCSQDGPFSGLVHVACTVNYGPFEYFGVQARDRLRRFCAVYLVGIGDLTEREAKKICRKSRAVDERHQRQ